MTPVERRIRFDGGNANVFQRKPRAKLDEAIRIAMECEAVLRRIVEADPASRASLIEEARKLVVPPPKPVPQPFEWGDEPVDQTPWRMRVIRSVLKAAEAVGDSDVVATCRRLMEVDGRNMRLKDWTLVLDRYRALEAQARACGVPKGGSQKGPDAVKP